MKFSQQHSFDNSKIEVTIDEDASLDEVLQSFTDFLRGCGYMIPYTSYLTIEDEDDIITPEDDHMDHWGQDVEFD